MRTFTSDNRRMVLALVIAVALLWGCGGSFDRNDADALVNDVGAERIRQAVDSLRPRAGTARSELPEASWPDALRELGPESIFVESDGVWVSKQHRFVEEAGIYVVFEGVGEPEERGGDPSMWRLGGRIFWYQITG
jgi:hypothetical protein